MGPLKPCSNKLGLGVGKWGSKKNVPAASLWLTRVVFPICSFIFVTHCYWRVEWSLINGNKKKITLNCSQKQGAPSEGHLSLSLQPPYCKFTTRRCFMYRGSLSELVWMGIHQKARSVLHENKPSVSYPRSLSRRPISCSISSSLPAPLPFFVINSH